MSYEIPQPPKISVRLMFAASQPNWIEREVTSKEYQLMFLTSTHEGLALVYIWPVKQNCMFDCYNRQWLTIQRIERVSERFFNASQSMSKKDKFNVRRLVHDCLKVKRDLGEDE